VATPVPLMRTAQSGDGDGVLALVIAFTTLVLTSTVWGLSVFWMSPTGSEEWFLRRNTIAARTRGTPVVPLSDVEKEGSEGRRDANTHITTHTGALNRWMAAFYAGKVANGIVGVGLTISISYGLLLVEWIVFGLFVRTSLLLPFALAALTYIGTVSALVKLSSEGNKRVRQYCLAEGQKT